MGWGGVGGVGWGGVGGGDGEEWGSGGGGWGGVGEWDGEEWEAEQERRKEGGMWREGRVVHVRQQVRRQEREENKTPVYQL